MQLMFLLPFFQWCDDTFLGKWVRSGQWEFPIIETIHILALTFLFAAVVVIDLRLMGLMMKGWTVSKLADELRVYLNWSIVVILITGTLLFLSEAVKAFDQAALTAESIRNHARAPDGAGASPKGSGALDHGGFARGRASAAESQKSWPLLP